MDLKELRCFVAVAEELHFGRAAKRLHISQPPVTQSIKRLEESLDVQLLERTKRYVQLTPAGTALLEEARRILSQTDNMKRTVKEAEMGQTGSLRAGFLATTVFTDAREHYMRILAELPGVSVNWEEMNSMDQVRALQLGQIDIGLVHTPLEHQGLMMRSVAREPLVIGLHVSHPRASSRSLSLKSLKQEHFILPPRHTAPGFYDSVISACNGAGFSPVIPHQARHMLTMISLVSINAGITLVPRWLRTCGFPDVVFLDIIGEKPMAEISLLWNPENESPVLARVLQMFDALLKKR
jgi:DNA-binding transcriptional LysR family regulator